MNVLGTVFSFGCWSAPYLHSVVCRWSAPYYTQPGCVQTPSAPYYTQPGCVRLECTLFALGCVQMECTLLHSAWMCADSICTLFHSVWWGALYLYSVWMRAGRVHPFACSLYVDHIALANNTREKCYIQKQPAILDCLIKKITKTRLYPCRPQPVKIPLPFKIIYTNIVGFVVAPALCSVI